MQISGITSEHTADNDGILGSPYRTLIDLTQDMRNKTGSQIRQGQTILVKSITIGVSPENVNGGEDQYGGAQAGGNILWFSPTKYRIRAWKDSFYHVQQQRKNAGIPRSSNYDFRVGLSELYPNVVQQAWSHDDNYPLVLLQTQTNEGAQEHTSGIFNSYNARTLANPYVELDVDSSQTLGQPYKIENTITDDDLDFMINDSAGFAPKVASAMYDTLPWAASFSGNNDWDTVFNPLGLEIGQDFAGIPGNVAVYQHHFASPAKVMCGLMAIDTYFTNIDDTADNEEFTVYYSIECVSGAKYLGRGKSRRRR